VNLMMYRKIFVTTMLAATTAILVSSAVGTQITTPAFAQEILPPDANMTGGNVTGNVTEGNMTTTPDLGGGPLATPPAITP
jgi:hypothetical protein